MIARAPGNVELCVASGVDAGGVAWQDALIGAVEAHAEEPDLAAVGMAGQDQIHPCGRVGFDFFRSMGKEDTACVPGHKRPYILFCGLLQNARYVQALAALHKCDPLVVQDPYAPLRKLCRDAGPVANASLMVALDEVGRPDLRRSLSEGAAILPPVRPMAVKEIPGDGNDIEGQTLYLTDKIPFVLAVGTVMEVRHLQYGELVESRRQTIELDGNAAHVKVVGVPPTVDEQARARYEKDANDVQQRPIPLSE